MNPLNSFDKNRIAQAMAANISKQIQRRNDVITGKKTEDDVRRLQEQVQAYKEKEAVLTAELENVYATGNTDTATGSTKSGKAKK